MAGLGMFRHFRPDTALRECCCTRELTDLSKRAEPEEIDRPRKLERPAVVRVTVSEAV